MDDSVTSGSRDLDAQTLKRIKPTRLVAIDDGGNVTSLAIPPGNRNKWDRVAKMARHYLSQGNRVEARDSKDSVLWVFEEESNVDAGVPDSTGRLKSDVAEVLALILKAQDHGAERLLSLIKPTLEAHVEMQRTLTDRLNQHEKLYTLVLRELYDATVAKAEAESRGSDSPGDALVGAVLEKAFAPMANGSHP